MLVELSCGCRVGYHRPALLWLYSEFGALNIFMTRLDSTRLDSKVIRLSQAWHICTQWQSFNWHSVLVGTASPSAVAELLAEAHRPQIACASTSCTSMPLRYDTRCYFNVRSKADISHDHWQWHHLHWLAAYGAGWLGPAGHDYLSHHRYSFVVSFA